MHQRLARRPVQGEFFPRLLVGRGLYAFEREAWRRGCRFVAGVDEAGRGPLAGPVVAAAVVLDPGRRIPGLRDSKLLAPARRSALEWAIRRRALGVGVAVVEAAEIDAVNILEATRRAMGEALRRLPVLPEMVLIDALALPDLDCPQWAIVHGDRRSASIAAASIVAKVTRDALMADYDRLYPGYGFGLHKGYGTRQHRAALARLGPCPIHRRTFRGVAEGHG